MPLRILVPEPQASEEMRLLAEAVADLHYVASLIVESASYLLPGESIDEVVNAWNQSEPTMRSLVQELTASNATAIPYPTLVTSELTGAAGKLKRSFLARLRDRFLLYWNSDPRTDDKQTKAVEAGADYLELGATVVSSIPGHEQVVEMLSLFKQLLGIRARRGV